VSSSYPPQRWHNTETGKEGVIGEIQQLQVANIGTQPVISFDWSRDKEGLAVMAQLDQTVRVVIVTRLGSL
jgi:hypothetical protein